MLLKAKLSESEKKELKNYRVLSSYRKLKQPIPCYDVKLGYALIMR